MRALPGEEQPRFDSDLNGFKAHSRKFVAPTLRFRDPIVIVGGQIRRELAPARPILAAE
jgi:hypothetical protein